MANAKPNLTLCQSLAVKRKLSRRRKRLIFLKRTEEWQQRDRETANLGEVIVGKHRHGSTGTVKLFWNAEFARFSNLTRDEYLPEQRG